MNRLINTIKTNNEIDSLNKYDFANCRFIYLYKFSVSITFLNQIMK